MKRFTRAHPCPICGGFDSMRRRAGIRCHGFLSDDGLYAHCARDGGGGRLRLEGGNTYPHLLRGRCRCGRRHDAESATVPAASRETIAPPPPTEPTDAASLWQSFLDHDPDGEAYLRSRSLDPLPPGVVGFNVEAGPDPWLARKATAGYRVGVRLFDASGAIRSIALRQCRVGGLPTAAKVLNLPGISTEGTFFALSTFWSAAQADDPIVICEGLTDFIGAAILTEAMAEERGEGSYWPFGVPGAGNVGDAIRNFDSVFRARRIIFVLDTDEAGRKATFEAVAAAKEIGAHPFVYKLPSGPKDLCDLIAQLEQAA